jgi:hypothetical protein
VLTKIEVIFLLFLTLWIILIIGYFYLKHRGLLAWGLPSPTRAVRGAPALPGGMQPAARGACCLEVPCSTECAQRHQEMSDRLAQRYDLVAAEAVKLVREQQLGADTDN